MTDLAMLEVPYSAPDDIGPATSEDVMSRHK